jgi:hypothetical protein
MYHKRLFRGPSTNVSLMTLETRMVLAASWPTPHTTPCFLPREDFCFYKNQ